MNKNIERKILLNPGPATTTETVKMSQIVNDICPREKEFTSLMAEIRNDLLKIINANKSKYTTVLFGGSGTAIIESVIASVVNIKKELLILINGAYGYRMKQIAETYSIPFKILEFRSDHPINCNDVKKYLELHPNIGYVAMVHHETTTGVLNSISQFSDIGKIYGHTLILDAISSYAGIPIDLEKTPIDYIMSTSNKCIQGMAGIAFAICNKFKIINLKNIPGRSFYLDLYKQYSFMDRTDQMRFTPPVQTVYAFKQAIDEFFKEGSINKYNRYKKSWNTLRNGLQQLGFCLLLNPEHESHILLTVIEPENAEFDFNIMHDLLYEKGYTIYPGKIENRKTFRLANMGAIDSKDIENFINELSTILTKMGIKTLKY